MVMNLRPTGPKIMDGCMNLPMIPSSPMIGRMSGYIMNSHWFNVLSDLRYPSNFDQMTLWGQIYNKACEDFRVGSINMSLHHTFPAYRAGIKDSFQVHLGGMK